MSTPRLTKRLGSKVLALLLLASAVPVGVMALIAFLRVRSMVVEDAVHLLSARSEQLVAELDGFHRSYLGSVRRLSSFQTIFRFFNNRPIDPTTIEGARSFLQSYVESDPHIHSATLFNMQGGVALTTDPDPRTRTASVANKRFFIAALKGSPIVSDIFLFEGSVEPLPMISYCAPVFGPDGTPAGAVALYVRAAAFWDAVRAGNGRAGPQSFSVLYDSSGIRIAHSFNDEEVFRPGGPLDSAVLEAAIAENRFGERTMTLLASPSPMLEEFARARAPLLVDQDVFRGFSPANSKWNLGVARRLHSVPWTLISQVPEDAIEGPVQNHLLSSSLIGLAIMAAALFFGWIGAQQILRPIRALSSAADAIARGEKNVNVHIPNQDELGNLGERFNAMAAAIESAQQDLATRVRERTLALERVNEELQSQKGELLAQQNELRAQRSELEDKNRQVAHADRLKSEFLTNMSHELRTPLNSVIGFSELILEESAKLPSARHKGYIENVLDSGRHLLRLINDILDLSKIEAGQTELDLSTLEPSASISEACTLLGAPAGKKRIQIAQECKAAQAVRADAGKLRQVLLNLLSNAVKFSPEGSTIEVGSLDADSYVRFFVRDHGPGIADSLMPRLFQPFVQGESPLNKKHEGTGLGLAISRRIVEQHGGVLDVESIVGKGSSFRFTMPAVKRLAPTLRIAQRNPGKPVVLMVEDDPEMAPELRALFEQHGYQVARADHGINELDFASRLRPAAIVLDPLSKWSDNLQLLDDLQRREATADIPVVLTSAPAARGFVTKPIREELLIKSCERAVTESPTHHPRSVLAIDDDPRVGTLLRSILEPAGYRVMTALRGQDGLNLARRDPPDLVIVDLGMPDVSGFEILEALAADERTRACPVIVMTAAELTEAERIRLRRHARALAEKGNFTRGELLAAVNRAVAPLRTTAPLGKIVAARILVVDDHDLNRELARSLLEGLGHVVLVAEDGEQGVKVARRELPDLILMDLAMPKQDGYSATRELKQDQATRDIPIVALTAMAMRGDEEKAFAVGVDAYLTKPIERRALADVIDRLLVRDI